MRPRQPQLREHRLLPGGHVPPLLLPPAELLPVNPPNHPGSFEQVEVEAQVDSVVRVILDDKTVVEQQEVIPKGAVVEEKGGPGLKVREGDHLGAEMEKGSPHGARTAQTDIKC